MIYDNWWEDSLKQAKLCRCLIPSPYHHNINILIIENVFFLANLSSKKLKHSFMTETEEIHKLQFASPTSSQQSLFANAESLNLSTSNTNEHTHNLIAQSTLSMDPHPHPHVKEFYLHTKITILS